VCLWLCVCVCVRARACVFCVCMRACVCIHTLNRMCARTRMCSSRIVIMMCVWVCWYVGGGGRGCSSRMMGSSGAVPRCLDPAWAHPLTAGAGGWAPGMYMYLYIYVYVYVYTYMYIYMHSMYINICINIFIDGRCWRGCARCIYMYVYVCMYIQMYVYMYMCIHMSMSEKRPRVVFLICCMLIHMYQHATNQKKKSFLYVHKICQGTYVYKYI